MLSACVFGCMGMCPAIDHPCDDLCKIEHDNAFTHDACMHTLHTYTSNQKRKNAREESDAIGICYTRQIPPTYARIQQLVSTATAEEVTPESAAEEARYCISCAGVPPKCVRASRLD